MSRSGGSSTNWTARACRQHDGHLHLRRQRVQRRGPARHASANCWRRTAFRTPIESSWPPWSSSAGWMRWADRRRTTCTTPAGPGRATRPSITPSWWPATSAEPATRWRSPGPGGSTPTTRSRRSSTMSTTSRRRSTRSSASPPPKVVDGHQQEPLDGISLAYTFTDADDRAASHAVFREHRQPGHLPRRLVRLRFRSVRSLGRRRLQPRIVDWDANRTSGSSTTCARDFSQADDLAAREPEAAGRAEGAVLKEAGTTRSCPSAPATGCACTRRTASTRPTRAGGLTPPRPGCRSSPPPAWAGRATASTST